MKKNTQSASLTLADDGSRIELAGDWNAAGIVSLSTRYQNIIWPDKTSIVIDGQAITSMDSAGAWLLSKIIVVLHSRHIETTLQDFPEKQLSLLEIVQKDADAITKPVPPRKVHNWFYRIGKLAYGKFLQIDLFLQFIGELAIAAIKSIRSPRRIQWRSIMSAIETTGYQALPIIALLTFLIGVVLTYQMGLELKVYGANIFIVNVAGMAILREFGPLITAIIAAGRTSSAFTAQIGTMIVNEEVDALRTMGLSPIDWLVIPKILGLMIAFPLLTVWADGFGILGSMMMAKASGLGINYHAFLSRFEEVVSINNYVIGLIKAPVFALIIAGVGCFQGFRVSSSAESVGHQTTKAVVQAIFLIIIADAIFSIIFSAKGI